MDLEFSDASAQIGSRTERGPEEPYSVEHYRSEMAHFGIAEAVVHHSHAKDYDPAHGNKLLMEEIAGDARLHPQWVILPPDTQELPPPEELVGQMKAHGVSSARIWPGAHNYQPEEFFLGEILGALEAERIPLFVDKSEVSWPQVLQLCQAHPRLRLVITRVAYRETRSLPSLLKSLKRLHIDTAWLSDHCVLEEYCQRFGADRFVYSSLWPFLSPANAMTLIGYARISDDEIQRIAFGNLRRLLKGEE